jgi:hypothetical protein
MIKDVKINKNKPKNVNKKLKEKNLILAENKYSKLQNSGNPNTRLLIAIKTLLTKLNYYHQKKITEYLERFI